MSSELEKYWNEKHPQQRLIYGGRTMSKVCPTCKNHTVTERMPLDVRNLICADDVMLQEVIIKHNLKADTFDETMLRIQKFVCSFLTYVGDDQQQGTPEYWQFPFETLYSKLGDCEDFAILIASLARNAGIPSYRIRVVAGLVKPHEITAPEGGHGWAMYLRGGTEDAKDVGEWVAIDGCFYADPHISIDQKPILRENPLYKEIWFSFNDQHAFASHDLQIEPRVTKMKSI